MIRGHVFVILIRRRPNCFPLRVCSRRVRSSPHSDAYGAHTDVGDAPMAQQSPAYSITSLALIKIAFGIDSPSNFAVSALTISSWVVGSSIGISPAVVPFRSLSIKYP